MCCLKALWSSVRRFVTTCSYVPRRSKSYRNEPNVFVLNSTNGTENEAILCAMKKSEWGSNMYLWHVYDTVGDAQLTRSILENAGYLCWIRECSAVLEGTDV